MIASHSKPTFQQRRCRGAGATTPRFVAVALAGIVLAALGCVQSLAEALTDGYTVQLDELGRIVGSGLSVAPGEVIGFALRSSSAAPLQLAITDAEGKRLHEFAAVRIGPPAAAGTEPWRTGAGYAVAASWRLPDTLPSGIYGLAYRPDMHFIVRESNPAKSRIRILLPTNTLNAYSITDGRSLYRLPTQVPEVSFLRPLTNPMTADWSTFAAWAGRPGTFGEPVGILADSDMEDAHALTGAKVLIVYGHSEYWTRAARLRFDTFIAGGGSVILAGGNDLWWQARLSADGTRMTAYKADALKSDPALGDPEPDPLLKTAAWSSKQLRLPILPSIGADFQHGGYGNRGHLTGIRQDGFVVSNGAHPLLAGTGLSDCTLITEAGSGEYDGTPILGLDVAGRPVPDLAAIGAARLQILAYRWVFRGGLNIAAMHVMQRMEGTGYVVHLSSALCCGSDVFADASQSPIPSVIKTAARTFLTGASPFAGDDGHGPLAFPMHTPWKQPLPAVPPGPCAPWGGNGVTAGTPPSHAFAPE